MLLDPAGEVLAVQYQTQTLVSQAKLDYESVTGILRGAPHQLSSQLKLLEQATQALSQQRQQQGAVYGQLLGGVYVDEDGRPITKTMKAQQMIAETMILTNRVVSEYMHSRQLPWIYRTHDYRDLEALPADKQRFIKALMAIEDEAALRKALANHYDRAQYQVTPGRHEGLALAVYTHFTSPIRRYVDVINHRLLKAAITGESVPYTTEQLEAIAAQLTAQQRVIKEKRQGRLREQAHSQRTALLEPTQLPQVGNLAPSEFSKVLKTAVKQGQLETLQPHILQRLEADTLQPLDFYQVFVVVPTTATNVTFKFQLLAAIADNPLMLQVVNLFIDNWKPGTKVEYREQGEMNAWAALCVVTSEGAEQCPPQWSVARSKSVARLQSAQQWLQSWLYEELTTPDQAQSSNDAIEFFQDGAVEPLATTAITASPPAVMAVVEDKTDYVTQLNLYAQQHAQPPTTYDFEGSGTVWQCRCYFLELNGAGKGTSKKLAKSAAAKDLWGQL